jgi:hypothetical protein
VLFLAGKVAQAYASRVPALCLARQRELLALEHRARRSGDAAPRRARLSSRKGRLLGGWLLTQRLAGLGLLAPASAGERLFTATLGAGGGQCRCLQGLRLADLSEISR